MGENNNKPVGFTGYPGPYARSLSIEKNSIWGLAIGNSVRPGPGRPVHLVWGPYGVCLGIPVAPDGVAEGRTISGKCPQSENTRILRKFC